MSQKLIDALGEKHKLELAKLNVLQLADYVLSRKFDRKFINDLPEAAFAVILAGGKKDSEGKTVPRSLRKLPHHNANVKDGNNNDTVDLPHLRNALARLPQSNMPASAKAHAERHLRKHAKALLKTEKDGN